MRPIVLAPIACLALALAAVALAAPWGRPALSPDSIVFYEVAEMLLAGEGLVFRPEQPGAAPIPLTAWAPGYPVALATVVTLSGATLDGAATLINLLSLWLVLALMLLLLRGHLSSSACFIALLLTAFSHPIQYAVGYAWSEALLMPWPLLALWYVERYAVQGDARKAILAAIAAVVAASIRHAGAIFVLLVPLAVLSSPRLPGVHRVRAAVVCVLLEALLMSATWGRNWRLTGALSGSDRGGSGHPERIASDLDGILTYVLRMSFANDAVVEAVLFWPVSAMFVWMAWSVWRHARTRCAPRTWLLPMIWVSGYILFLLFARATQTEIEVLGGRMLSVVWPMAIVALARFAAQAWQVCRSFAWHAAIAAVIALHGYTALILVIRVQANWSSLGSPHYMLTFGTTHRNFRADSQDARDLLTPIGDFWSVDAVFVDNLPHVVRYLTGLPSYRWTTVSPCSLLDQAGEQGIIVAAGAAERKQAEHCLEGRSGWQLKNWLLSSVAGRP